MKRLDPFWLWEQTQEERGHVHEWLVANGVNPHTCPHFDVEPTHHMHVQVRAAKYKLDDEGKPLVTKDELDFIYDTPTIFETSIVPNVIRRALI